MYIVEPYKFKSIKWTKQEIDIFINIVKNFKKENYSKFIKTLSTLSTESSNKIFEELKHTGEYFKNIVDIADREEAKDKLVNAILDSKTNLNVNSAENFDINEAYLEHRDKFSEWLFNSKVHNYARSVSNDCIKLFECDVKTIPEIKKEITKNKNLPTRINNSFRSFLTYLEEETSISPVLINEIRMYIKGGVGEHVDRRVPTEEEILKSISIMRIKYTYDDLMLYFLLIESGCRFEELKKLILEYDCDKFVAKNEEFSYYKMFWRRGRKNAFILFFRTKTIKHVIDNLSKYQDDNYLKRFKRWIQKNENIESAKYLRKFSFTEMVHSSDIDMATANLFQGRITMGDIGEKHYLDIERVMVKHYIKFVRFLKILEKND